MAQGRRAVLFMGGAAALVAAVQYGPGLTRRLIPPPMDFRPMADPPGFRRLGGGAVSGGAVGSAIFAGLDSGDPAPASLPPGAFCAALFDGLPSAGGRVRIASFSDYFCPYCRVLDTRLRRIEAEDPRVTVAWHEVPLLGPASVMAARAALAADLQDARGAMAERLIATPFRPTDAWLRAAAIATGADAERLLADMSSRDVDRRLEQAASMFARLGFAGTPGLVVGRTVVSGAIDAQRLARLIDLEAAEPAACDV